MSHIKKSEIEKFRGKFENPVEWKMRREFITTYFDSYDIERLICLSHCYINIVFYGNAYPLDIMKEVCLNL